MEKKTASGRHVPKVVCSSVMDLFDSGPHNVNSCALSGFNTSNLSEARLYGRALDVGSLSVKSHRDTDPLDWDDLWRGIPLGIVLALLCLLTTVGNIMVLHAVRTEKRLQTVSNLFIVSLAVADVIVGIIVMPMSTFYIFTERWMLGVAVCQIWIGVDYTASTASILNLFILSLDRYWSVRQPLKYLHKRTKRRAFSMIAFVWAVSSLWIIPISSWHHFAYGGTRTVPSDKCDTEYAKNSILKIITAFFNFYLPLTVMYILYLRIFIAIRKRSDFELGQRNPGGTVLSYKSNIVNSNSIEGSEYNNGLSCSVEHRLGRAERHQENGTQSYISASNRNLRGVTVRRHPRPYAYKDANFRLYKVEYIYDENVIDPQTEKIERYYYEDHYPVSCLSRPTWKADREKCPVASKRGLLRSSCRLENLQIPLQFYSMSSLANSNKSNDSRLNDQEHIQHVEKSRNNRSFMATKLETDQTKCNNCQLYMQSSVRHERYKQSESEEGTEQSCVSSSFSLSARVCDDDCGDESEKNCSQDNCDIRFPEDKRKCEAYRSMFRDNSCDHVRTRNIKVDLSYVNRMTSSDMSSDMSMDGSFSKNDDGSDGIVVLQEEENRSFVTIKNGFKERLGTIRQSSSLNKEIKAAKQLGVIMGAFTLCFLPYFILFLVVAFCDNCIKPSHLTAATWIGYLNSTLNPFLYPLCNANFRSKFRAMLTCSAQKRSPLRATQTDYLERNTNFQSRYD